MVFEDGGIFVVQVMDPYACQLVAEHGAAEDDSERPHDRQTSVGRLESSRNTANRRRLAETSNFAHH